MKIQRALIGLTAALLLAPALACAAGAETSEFVEVSATVKQVDVARRTVGLTTMDGRTVVIDVDPSVQNLATVKPGDRVVVRYTQAVAANVVKSQAPAVVSDKETARTAIDKTAAKPSATGKREIKAVIRVDAIDTATNALSFTGPNGARTILVRDPKMQAYLKTLKVGDSVEVTYTEIAAISVQPAK